MGPGLAPASAEVQERYWMIAPFAFEDGTLWSGRPFSRLNIPERRQEVLSPPDPRLNRPTGSWHSLEFIPDQQALLASMTDQIWLLRLLREVAEVTEKEQETKP